MISNIDDIKAAADILEVIQDFVKLKRSGANYVGLCPFHNEKTPSFTVSPTKGIFKCFGCTHAGDVIDFIQEHQNINYVEAIKFLANKYNIPIDETVRKTYEIPTPRLQKVSQPIVEYFEKRGISNNTLLRFNITEAVEWMPKTQTETSVICFNYFKDEQLVNIKFRGKGKDFKLSKNAELIFYNIDALKNETSAVIVEGEIDALSLHEAGIYNVVSVPNGAGIGQQQLKYLDNCWKEFEDKNRIVIMTDNDDPGNKVRDEISRRLGRERCYRVTWPEDCKDANEVLVKHGKGMLISMVDQARQWPVEGVLTMDDLYGTVDEYYTNGYPEGFIAGIGEFDDLLSFSGGQLTTVTGSPGSGKSEFIDYLSTSLARRHRWKFVVCSFENPATIHVTKLMEKFTGLSFSFRKDPTHRMSRDDFNTGIALVDQYFSFLDIAQADVTIAGILSKCRELVLRTGIKGVIIDPWNYIEHKVPPGYTETQYISEALSLIKEFAIRNDVHVFLVAHPRKLMKDPKTKQYPVASMYDISGSAHFFNKTDNGISIHRDFANGTVTAYVQKVRFSWLGKCGFTTYSFDTFTRQYLQI